MTRESYFIILKRKIGFSISCLVQSICLVQNCFIILLHVNDGKIGACIFPNAPLQDKENKYILRPE